MGKKVCGVGCDEYDVAVSQTYIDLEDALRHHDGWSEETRLYIRSEMDRIGAATFRNDVHGYWNSVKVYDATGEFLADILKTKVWYAATVAPEGATEVNSWVNSQSCSMECRALVAPLAGRPRQSQPHAWAAT